MKKTRQFKLKHTIGTRFTEEEYEKIVEIAEEYEIAISSVVRQCVQQALGIKEECKKIPTLVK